MVDDFAIDSMHAIYQNWMKRFWSQMHAPREDFTVSHTQFLQIGDEWAKHVLPREFVRPPRSFTYFPRFKATELRSLLLYGGDLVLDGVVSDKVLNIYRLFMLGIRILSDKDLCQDEVRTKCFQPNFVPCTYLGLI